MVTVLPERDRARGAELRDDAGVAARPVPGVDGRSVLGGLVAGVEDVLHAEHDARQRSGCRPRFVARAVAVEERPRVNGGLPLVDSRQRALDRVERGHVTPVMVTFPAVSRTVSCTLRTEPSASVA